MRISTDARPRVGGRDVGAQPVTDDDRLLDGMPTDRAASRNRPGSRLADDQVGLAATRDDHGSHDRPAPAASVSAVG